MSIEKEDIYEVLNDKGEVINRIVAKEWFVKEFYPGRHRLEEAAEPEIGEESDIDSEAEPEITAPSLD